MDAFGENLYNTYGSTEVAWATIAQPQDMRDAPGTAGKPPYNTVVKIYDEDGQEVEQGASRVASSSATRCSSAATPATPTRRRT